MYFFTKNNLIDKNKLSDNMYPISKSFCLTKFFLMPTEKHHRRWPLRPGEVLGVPLSLNKFDQLSKKSNSKNIKRKKFPVKNM